MLFLKKSQEIAPPEIDRWWLLCFSRHRLSHCVYIERPLACKYTRNVRVHAALGARGVRRSNNAGGGVKLKRGSGLAFLTAIVSRRWALSPGIGAH